MAETMLRTLVLPVLVGMTALSACAVPQTRDFAEVDARWDYKTHEDCPSFLYSYRSGRKYCASPGFKVVEEWEDPAFAGAKDAAAEIAVADVDPTNHDQMMQLGGQVYGQVCVACHQSNGQGLAGSFPPLAGSGEFYGEPQNMAKIIVGGLSGEISVQGTVYNSVMPPQGHLSDKEIAAVATFVRNSWGNDDGNVAPEDVAAVR